MACMTMRAGVSLEERMVQVKAALKRLEQKLLSNQARVVIAPNGAVTFAGWTAEERSDVTDVCAYRTLVAESSWALRQAVTRAEAASGRKVNANAVAAGWHSHDAGKTWGTH